MLGPGGLLHWRLELCLKHCAAAWPDLLSMIRLHLERCPSAWSQSALEPTVDSETRCCCLAYTAWSCTSCHMQPAYKPSRQGSAARDHRLLSVTRTPHLQPNDSSRWLPAGWGCLWRSTLRLILWLVVTSSRPWWMTCPCRLLLAKVGCLLCACMHVIPGGVAAARL